MGAPRAALPCFMDVIPAVLRTATWGVVAVAVNAAWVLRAPEGPQQAEGLQSSWCCATRQKKAALLQELVLSDSGSVEKCAERHKTWHRCSQTQ